MHLLPQAGSGQESRGSNDKDERGKRRGQLQWNGLQPRLGIRGSQLLTFPVPPHANCRAIAPTHPSIILQHPHTPVSSCTIHIPCINSILDVCSACHCDCICLHTLVHTECCVCSACHCDCICLHTLVHTECCMYMIYTSCI